MYLALDQSPKRIGFAYGTGLGAPGSGRLMLDVEPLTQLRNWLNLMMLTKGVTHVGYEAPFVGPKTRHDILFRMVELPAIIKLCCLDAGVPCEAVPPPTWRKHFIGFGRCPKGIKKSTQHLKDAAMMACNERNWPIASDDEADALGILDYLLSRDFPSYGTSTTELFAGHSNERATELPGG